MDMRRELRAALLVTGFLVLATGVAIIGAYIGLRKYAESPTPKPALYVEWPEQCAYGWVVRWEYNGIATPSMHETKEQALRLYAVLAGRMVDRE